MENSFKAAFGCAPHWRDACAQAVAGLAGPPDDKQPDNKPGLAAQNALGFVYLTGLLADNAADIVRYLRRETGVATWVGTTGVGVCALGRPFIDEPALAIMVCPLGEGQFKTFEADPANLAPSLAALADWLPPGSGHTGVVHADPRAPEAFEAIAPLGEACGVFFVGGLASSQHSFPQIAGGVTEGGLSGVVFAPSVTLFTGLSQGCTPIGPVREITKCHDDIAIEIDGRPAYEVFAEDIGPVMQRSLSHTGGYIFAGFPLPGSERQDYLLREITGLDPQGNRLRLAAHLSAGRRIMFCRRDPYSALADLDVMLEETRDRLIARGGRPRGALYFSCTGRGAPMFGSGNAELETISDVLGENVPVIGFYANGEVSANHLYGYSAVIALFG